MGSKTKNKGTSSLVQDPPRRLFEFDTVGGALEDDVSSNGDETPEKDEAEEKLERLLFGDDDGFQAALKSHHHGGEQTTDLVRKSGQDGTDGEGSENEEDMTNMDDADVFPPFALSFVQH
jgi:U3 small nucleolar RNA-associated protein 18